MVLEREGAFAEAEYALEWAVRLDREGAWVHVAKGRFLLRRERAEDALTVFEAALARAPELPDAHAGAGAALILLGDDAAAEPHLWIAVEAAPSSETCHLLAMLHLRAGDRTRATDVLDRWSALPISGTDAADRAEVALALGRAEAAVDDLVLALGGPGAAPEQALLLVQAAAEGCRIGTAWRWADGVVLAERADPAWRRAAWLIARLAGDEGMEAAAARDLDPLPLEPPHACDPQPLLARAAGLPASDALPLLERAADVAPLSPPVLDALAATYHDAGMVERAQAIERRRDRMAVHEEAP